jgi:hypothetical protein
MSTSKLVTYLLTGKNPPSNFTPASAEGAAVKQRRIVPCKPSTLRRGGGRQDRPGWTKQKLQTTRRSLRALDHIKSCLTITCPPDETPSTYKYFNQAVRSHIRTLGLPCVCVWEGPNPHCHIAFAGNIAERQRKALKRAVENYWLNFWERVMPDGAFYIDPAPKASTAEYLGKVKKKKAKVKAAYDWLAFTPYWKAHIKTSRQIDVSIPAGWKAAPESQIHQPTQQAVIDSFSAVSPSVLTKRIKHSQPLKLRQILCPRSKPRPTFQKASA